LPKEDKTLNSCDDIVKERENVLLHGMKASGGTEAGLHSFLTSALEGNECPASRPGRPFNWGILEIDEKTISCVNYKILENECNICTCVQCLVTEAI